LHNRTTSIGARFAIYGLICTINVLFSQNTFNDLLNRAADYQRAGHFDEARKLLAGTLSRAGKNSDVVATILNNLGSVYQDMGDLREAERCYRRAVEMIESTTGPESIGLASPLNNLGSLYLEQSKYSKSIEVRRRSLAIREKAYGPDNPEVAAVLRNLAVAYMAAGAFAEAEGALQRSLAILENAFGPNTTRAALVWNDFGVLRWKQKNYPAAADYLTRAIDVLDRVDLIKPLANLASVHLAQQDTQQAELFLQRAQSIAEQELGPDHPLLGRILDQYAGLLRQMNRKTEAKQSEMRAKAIRAHQAATVDLGELALRR
jgi:tetratricopeptide (TPR) repeat protein